MNMRMLAQAVACLAAVPAIAADWPQWQGPDRTNISREAGLMKSWPKAGPKLLWTFENAGIGYSGPAIVGDKVYILGSRGGKENLICLDARAGKELWASPYGAQFNNGYGDGPRCTPTVDGDSVYLIGGQGEIGCFDAASGKSRWQKSMQKDLGGQMMSGWGYSESPLVDGDRLILTPGGGKGTLAALDKKTGKEIWRSKGLTDPAAYSSVISATVGDVKMYVNLTGKGVAGVSAKDGQQLFYHREDGYRTAVVPTPIFSDNHVYATAGYGAGCDLLKLTPDGKGGVKMDVVYAANKTMQNHHGGVVLVGDHIYGCSGNSNGRASWVCQEFKSGKSVWSESKLDPGSLTCVDGQLYLYSQKDGTCVLIDASPAGWKENGRFKIPKETKVARKQGKIWTHPVVANGMLFLRDEDLLFCFDVRAATASVPK